MPGGRDARVSDVVQAVTSGRRLRADVIADEREQSEARVNGGALSQAMKGSTVNRKHHRSRFR